MVRFSKNMSLEDRECPCDECEFNQEGYCIADLEYPELDWEGYECNCKSNDELITEEEYDKDSWEVNERMGIVQCKNCGWTGELEDLGVE